MWSRPWHQLFLYFLGWFMVSSSLAQSGGIDPLVSTYLAAFCALVGTLATCWNKRDYGYQLPLVASALLFAFLVLYWQCGEIDDDFFVHAPVQSLLEFCGIPPGNPYMPQISLGGHFGRDVVISGFAYLAGASPIVSQIWLTALVHGCLFLTLTDWLRACHLPAMSVCLAGWLFFVGVCVGSRFGFLDCYQNNNSFAFAFNFLALTACQEYVDQPGSRSAWVRMLVALVCVGVCYEMLWGLVVLTMGLLAVRKPTLKALLAASLLSVLMILACSGSLQHILSNSPRSAAPGSFGEATQSQSVTIQFPSSEPGCVFMTPNHSEVVSVGFTMFPGAVHKWVANFPFEPDRRVCVLSPSYLRQHWLATWLAPLVLGYGVWRRSHGLVAAWLFAALAFFLPSVVNFGPVYDHENYRWSYTAGSFFTISFGVALGLIWGQVGRPMKWLLLGGALFSAWPGLCHYRWRCDPVWHGDFWEHVGRSCNSTKYYQAQADLHFTPALRDAALWLAEHARPGQVVISDISLSRDWKMLEEAVFLAVARLRSSGHAYPTVQDPVGTQPYRSLAWYRAFWAAPQRTTMDRADWVVQTRSDSPSLKEVVGLKSEAIFRCGEQTVSIYSVKDVSSPPSGLVRASLQEPEKSLTPQAELGTLFWLELRCEPPLLEKPALLTVDFVPQGAGLPESYRWSFLPQKSLRAPLAVPSQPGVYQATVKLGEVVLRTFSLQVVQTELSTPR